MSNKVLKSIDATIKKISEKIQDENLSPGEYADTVKALASLVEARAKLN